MGQTDNFVLDKLEKPGKSHRRISWSAPRLWTRGSSLTACCPPETAAPPLPCNRELWRWALQDGQVQYLPTSGGTNQHTVPLERREFVPAPPQLNAQMSDDATLISDDDERVW